MTESEAKKIRLTHNFSLWEMLYSEKAFKKGLMIYQLDIPELYILNLKRLAVNILQPLRDELKMPIKINSGYRSQELNDYIKGSPTSDHMAGKAADIYIPGHMDMAFGFIKNRCNFKQLINEQDLSWIHISYDEFDNKKQILYL